MALWWDTTRSHWLFTLNYNNLWSIKYWECEYCDGTSLSHVKWNHSSGQIVRELQSNQNFSNNLQVYYYLSKCIFLLWKFPTSNIFFSFLWIWNLQKWYVLDLICQLDMKRFLWIYFLKVQERGGNCMSSKVQAWVTYSLWSP